MPLCSNSKKCSQDRLPEMLPRSEFRPPASEKRSSRCIAVGLINNMPDAALEATERQFRSLLAAASDGMTVRLQVYALPELPRTEAAKRHIAKSYSNIQELWHSPLDGLIVTGAEPRMASLTDEPYWESFTRVLEWAQDNTSSTVFSCLAAHAAILRMDGISRVRSNHKHFGVYDCARLSDHRIVAGAPLRFKLPHSRWNGISEDDLTANGYSVLTRTIDAGVDIFVKRRNALFVFFQSHPEYESDTLLREYRRDVGRYLKGQSNIYPSAPRSYFDSGTLEQLEDLRKQAVSAPAEGLQAELSELLDGLTVDNPWNAPAVCIYRNWLQYIQERKDSERKDSERKHARQGADLTVLAGAREVAAMAARRGLPQMDGPA